MKKVLVLIVLTSLFFSSFAQIPSEEIDPIQKFIEATVQIPFQARLANIQGKVAVRITMGNNRLPDKYEITQSLTEACDKEALRVVKLINPKYINDTLAGKNSIVLEVPFFNPSLLYFDKGYLIEYYDKDKKPYVGETPTYMQRYLVDTLSGMIKSNIEYFTVRNNGLKPLEVVNLKMDSWKHEPKTELLENPSDSMKIHFKTARSNFGFPFFAQGVYDNGQVCSINFNEESYTYYPNGRIASMSQRTKEGNEYITRKTEWFANGLMASIVVNTWNGSESNSYYLTIWDAQGKQIVQNGEGSFEYCERIDDEVLFHAGVVKKGLKEGQWKGKNTSGEVLFEDTYQKGKFVKGISFDNGQILEYNEQEVSATFVGGIAMFTKHLQNHLTYPVKALKAKVQGRVYVQCTVGTDGTLSDFIVLKGIGSGCDEEAVKVIQLSSGQWIPGKKRGKIAKTKFTMPISFTMN